MNICHRDDSIYDELVRNEERYKTIVQGYLDGFNISVSS